MKAMSKVAAAVVLALAGASSAVEAFPIGASGSRHAGPADVLRIADEPAAEPVEEGETRETNEGAEAAGAAAEAEGGAAEGGGEGVEVAPDENAEPEGEGKPQE